MKKLIPAAVLAAALISPLAAHAQTSQTYAGNGATGFGGNIGNASFKVSSDTSGNITFALTPSGGGGTGNDTVVYIDSVTGGFANTSTFTDNGDGGREAISGYNSGNATRTLATFAPGFNADYALSIEDGYFSLFDLSTSTATGSFNYITGAGQTGSPYTLTLAASQLGLSTNTSQFKFVGTLISTSAYRSNETIGTSTTTDNGNGAAPNAGFTGSTTFTSSDTFGTAPAAAPEPGSLVPLAMGALALGGLVAARRRRTASAAL